MANQWLRFNRLRTVAVTINKSSCNGYGEQSSNFSRCHTRDHTKWYTGVVRAMKRRAKGVVAVTSRLNGLPASGSDWKSRESCGATWLLRYLLACSCVR